MTMPGFLTTDFGQPNTRYKSPVLSGSIYDGGSTALGQGPIPPPGGFICVQSTASILTQIITTTGQLANASFVYIPQGTVGVTSSNTATVGAAPPYTGSGAALYFDYTRKKLSIYSTGVGDWLSVTLSSS